jgi:hypothetical protein
MPAFWITFNPSDSRNPLGLIFAEVLFSGDIFAAANSAIREAAATWNPVVVAVAEVFYHVCKATFDGLLGSNTGLHRYQHMSEEINMLLKSLLSYDLSHFFFFDNEKSTAGLGLSGGQCGVIAILFPHLKLSSIYNLGIPKRVMDFDVPKRRLLLIYIHGLNGTEATFQDLPVHVHSALTGLLDESHVIHTRVYPGYKSQGEFQVAVTQFSRWYAIVSGWDCSRHETN